MAIAARPHQSCETAGRTFILYIFRTRETWERHKSCQNISTCRRCALRYCRDADSVPPISPPNQLMYLSLTHGPQISALRLADMRKGIVMTKELEHRLKQVLSVHIIAAPPLHRPLRAAHFHLGNIHLLFHTSGVAQQPMPLTLVQMRLLRQTPIAHTGAIRSLVSSRSWLPFSRLDCAPLLRCPTRTAIKG